jgi:hypothetical protein
MNRERVDFEKRTAQIRNAIATGVSGLTATVLNGSVTPHASYMHLSFEKLEILLYCYLSARSPEHSNCVRRRRLLLNHLAGIRGVLLKSYSHSLALPCELSAKHLEIFFRYGQSFLVIRSVIFFIAAWTIMSLASPWKNSHFLGGSLMA